MDCLHYAAWLYKGAIVIDFIILYFVFGSGMYLGMALNNPISFLDANAAALIRGLLLCLVFWSVGLIFKIVEILIGDKNETT